MHYIPRLSLKKVNVKFGYYNASCMLILEKSIF
jgi:hypothetical protein